MQYCEKIYVYPDWLYHSDSCNDDCDNDGDDDGDGGGGTDFYLRRGLLFLYLLSVLQHSMMLKKLRMESDHIYCLH